MTGLFAHLIACVATRLQHFRVVTFAVDLVVVYAIGEIHQQLLAGGALEAPRMPDHLVSEFRCDHSQFALIDALVAVDTVGRVRSVFHVT